MSNPRSYEGGGVVRISGPPSVCVCVPYVTPPETLTTPFVRTNVSPRARVCVCVPYVTPPEILTTPFVRTDCGPMARVCVSLTLRLWQSRIHRFPLVSICFYIQFA